MLYCWFTTLTWSEHQSKTKLCALSWVVSISTLFAMVLDWFVNSLINQYMTFLKGFPDVELVTFKRMWNMLILYRFVFVFVFCVSNVATNQWTKCQSNQNVACDGKSRISHTSSTTTNLWGICDEDSTFPSIRHWQSHCVIHSSNSSSSSCRHHFSLVRESIRKKRRDKRERHLLSFIKYQQSNSIFIFIWRECHPIDENNNKSKKSIVVIRKLEC